METGSTTLKEAPLTAINHLPALDWNDIRLMLEVDRLGSFSAAAGALGFDQATVSRRIARLEDIAGAPLFRRMRTGAVPTEIGLALLTKAATIAEHASDFHHALCEVRASRHQTLVIQASEGVLSFLLSPLVLRQNIGPMGQVLAANPDLGDFPPTKLISDATRGEHADIRLVWVTPGRGPVARDTDQVRRVATIRFVPFSSPTFQRMQRNPIRRFEDLTRVKLLSLSAYASFDESLGPWNAVVDSCQEPCLIADFTSTLERPTLSGAGVTLLPTYAPMFSPDFWGYEFKVPDMCVELWLCAGEYELRRPVVRRAYDLLSKAFTAFPW
ncbi:MAG: LysR family transcriptional regulator [Alphaproteobacteria bacterium]|nr:LysR family transcriptional regulator [Alphaproteobacteria bacterium]